MLVAAFMATAFHAGLINLEFTVKPVLVPGISFPHSVNVFLNQRNTDQMMPAKPEPQMKAVKNNPPVAEKTDDFLQPSVITAETVKKSVEAATKKSEPVVEEIVPASREPKHMTDGPVSQAGKDYRIHKTTPDQSSQATNDTGGQKTPGTIQMAYPRYRLNSPPSYPGLARKRGQEGTVILQVLVDRQGRVDDLEIERSSGTGLLDRAALSAVRKWSFEPGRKDREKIAMWVRVPVTFKLKQ
jgi:protein TonB